MVPVHDHHIGYSRFYQPISVYSGIGEQLPGPAQHQRSVGARREAHGVRQAPQPIVQ